MIDVQSIAGDVNVTELNAEFDRIVTNEMFEHMKNYEKLFEKVSKWLKPETGLLFIHVFCHRFFPYQFKVNTFKIRQSQQCSFQGKRLKQCRLDGTKLLYRWLNAFVWYVPLLSETFGNSEYMDDQWCSLFEGKLLI